MHQSQIAEMPAYLLAQPSFQGDGVSAGYLKQLRFTESQQAPTGQRDTAQVAMCQMGKGALRKPSAKSISVALM